MNEYPQRDIKIPKKHLDDAEVNLETTKVKQQAEEYLAEGKIIRVYYSLGTGADGANEVTTQEQLEKLYQGSLLTKVEVIEKNAPSIEKPKIDRTLEVLADGGEINYAPLSGGIILLDKAGKPSSTKIDISTFLELQKQDRIKHTGDMRQGHHIFHGRVDFYKIKE